MGIFDLFKGKNKPKETKEVLLTPPSKTNTDNTTKQFYSIPVADVVRETPDSISVYLAVPSDLETIFAYKAGQYVTLRVSIGGQSHLRSYSLSSYADGFYRIAIKKKQGGAVSGYLLDHCRQGQHLDVFPPLGNFSPRLDNSTQHYFLFAGGSGITPMLSILKAVLHHKKQARIVLFYANKNAESIIYHQEIEALQAQYSNNLTVWYALDLPPAQWTGLTGIYTADTYAQWLQTNYGNSIATDNEAEYFVCGPTAMMQEVQTALLNRVHIAENRFHVEYFDIEKQAHDVRHQMATDDNNNSNPTDSNNNASTKATVILGGKKHVLDINKGQTVLQTCLDKHLDAPFMCEAGVCSSCKAKLVSGKVAMAACYALSEREIAEGYILTCQSIPQTPEIVVSYDL